MNSYDMEWTQRHQDPMCDRYTIHTLWSFIDYLDHMVGVSRVNIRIHTALPQDTPMDHFDLVYSLHRPESYQPNQRFFVGEFPFALTRSASWLSHLVQKMIDALSRLLHKDIVIHVFHPPKGMAFWDHICKHIRHANILTHCLGGFDLVHALKMDRTLFFDIYKDQRYLYKVKPYTYASENIFVMQLPWHNVCLESRFFVIHTEQLWNKIPNLAPASIEWTDTQPEQLPLIPVAKQGVLQYTPNTEYSCVYKVPLSTKTSFLYDYSDKQNPVIFSQIKQFTQDLINHGWYAAILNIGCFLVDERNHVQYYRHEHLYKGTDESNQMQTQMLNLGKQLSRWRKQVGKKQGSLNWPRYLRNKQLLAIHDDEIFYTTSGKYILSIRSPNVTPFHFYTSGTITVENGSMTYPPHIYDLPDPLIYMKRSNVVLTLFDAKTTRTVTDYMYHHPDKRNMILQALVLETDRFIKKHLRYIDDYESTLFLIKDGAEMDYYDFAYGETMYTLITVPFTIVMIKCGNITTAVTQESALHKSCIALARTFNNDNLDGLLDLLSEQNILKSFPERKWIQAEKAKALHSHKMMSS